MKWTKNQVLKTAFTRQQIYVNAQKFNTVWALSEPWNKFLLDMGYKVGKSKTQRLFENDDVIVLHNQKKWIPCT